MCRVTNFLIRQFCLVKQTKYLLSYKLQDTITLPIFFFCQKKKKTLSNKIILIFFFQNNIFSK